MFKKLKDKLADEVKQNPRLQGTLDSVNQLAVQTYANFNKEGSGSRDSLTSLSSQVSSQVPENGQSGQGGQGNSSQSDLLSLFSSPAAAPAPSSVSSNSAQFFSLGEDDDPVSLSNSNSPTKTPTPNTIGVNMASTPLSSRNRRLSSSSQDASLFPIWEDPGRENAPLFSDMEDMSCAGSEAGWDDAGSAQLGAVSKEQLYTMLSKMRGRYHKYKGRYSDLSKAYRDLEGENRKVKEVMQQTQDRALRRIGELREQAGLEKQAKAHLEEELRAELEEKEHIIVTLNTKVVLLKEVTKGVSNGEGGEVVSEQQLVDVSADSGFPLEERKEVQEQGEGKQPHMEEKVRRLESLLSKCKENIKANKQKTVALTEVKEQLALDLAAREQELEEERSRGSKVEQELQELRGREAGEELQMAEVKMAMHKEMLVKDEEITGLRGSLASVQGEREVLAKEVDDLKVEMVQMGAAQDALEKRMEEERKAAMEELSRGKEAALGQERERIQAEHKAEVTRELSRSEEKWGQRVREVEEEGRLGREELELRLAAASKLGEEGNKVKSLEADVSRLLKEQSSLSARLQEAQAARIVMEEQGRQMVAAGELAAAEMRNKVEEKEKEGRLAQESMAKIEKELKEEQGKVVSLEKELKEEQEKVVRVEKRLEETREEHRQNLDILKASVQSEQESSELKVTVEAHTVEIQKKETEIRVLQEKLEVLEEAGKELQERIDINLDSSMKNEEEYEQKIGGLEKQLNTLETNLKECEDNLSGKAEELRDANDKVEDLQTCLEQMQNAEAKFKEMKDLLDQKALELRDANEELEEFKRIADERGNSKIDLEKELIGLREQVNSRQALHDQMVGYEKELHSRISTLENETTQVKREKSDLENEVEVKTSEIDNLKTAIEEERCKVKQDREMKIRLEREKETAHKEFQKQSIEYEKRLQDHLEESSTSIVELKKDIVSEKKESLAIKENYEGKISALEAKLEKLLEKFNASNDMSNNMVEKCDLIENILDSKERLVETLENDKVEMAGRLVDMEVIKQKYAEEQRQLNKIIEDNQDELKRLKGDQEDMEKLQTENRKLSKSRDRLKSLLDEKEKVLTDLQGERALAEGSREEVDQRMKERVSTLAEEVAKTNELKESLQCEVYELKNNLENISREVQDKNALNETLVEELDALKKASGELSKEKENVSDEKQSIQKELEDATKQLENALKKIDLLGDDLADNSRHKSELVQALSDMKISGEEMDNLKIKLKQMESMSNMTELKEENAMLTERLNQYEEEKIQFISSSEKLYEEKWREERESLEVLQARERQVLEGRVVELEEEARRQREGGMTEETEVRVKSLVREMEKKMARLEAEHEEELERLREAQEVELAQVTKEHRELVSRLNSDLRHLQEQVEMQGQEREAAMVERKEQEEEEQERHREEYRKVTAQVLQLQAKVSELERSKGDWGGGWDDGDPTYGQGGDSPAIFGVPHPQPHPVQAVPPPVTLEEYPEFEYLRNILFQYMCGRQPHILAKVLAAIVKFNPDQVSEIMRSEDRKASYLTSLGLS